MIDVLVALRDPTLSDLVRTAFRNRPCWRPFQVPPESLEHLLSGPSAPGLAVFDLDPAQGSDLDCLERLKTVKRSTVLVGVGGAPGAARELHSRLELDVAMIISVPIEPFDLARRLLRLESIVAAS